MGRLAASIILLTGWRRSLLAFLAGALAVLTQAPFDFPAVGFVSFTVLVWLVDGAAAATTPGLLARFKPSFATGYWFGFGYFLAGLWWIGGAVLVEADAFAWALPFAVLGIPIVLAVFYGLATALARLLWSDGLGRIAALAFGFGFAEWLRGFIFTGFPWNSIGYAMMPVPLLMQSVEVVGLIGMNALAVFVFAVPALFGTRRGAVIGTAIAAILIATHVGYGYYRLSLPGPGSTAAVSVRVVQPNVDLSEKWDASVRDRIFKSMLEMSARPVAEGQRKPSLIVWPETSVPYILSENPAALSAIGDMLQAGQVLIAGAVREESASADGTRYYNSVIQIDESGQIIDAVDKVHLVPFGEYLPFQEVFARFGLRQLVAGPMDFAPGVERHPLRVSDAIFAMPYICYEVIFPELMPDAKSRANLLINLTNDAWFGATPGPYQHLRQAQLRSVETRKPMVRVANTGISAVIADSGAIDQGLALNTAGVIDATVSIPAMVIESPLLDPSRNGFLVLTAFIFIAGLTRLIRR